MNTLIEAGEDVASYHVCRAIESAENGGGYLRIAPSRAGASAEMDDASERNIAALQAAAAVSSQRLARAIAEHIA